MTDDMIEEFVRSFEDCSVPSSEWTHRKHLVMALWYIRRFPAEEATTRIRDGLQRYSRSLGKHRAYHETITLGWVAVIRGFLARQDTAAPISTLAEALVNTCGEQDYLLRHYSKGVLMSEEARNHWVPPDRTPFE